jgi:cysteine-rich repeat protein
MLERYTEHHGVARRRRLGPAASLSITAHVGALGAFLVAAVWQVDKLSPPDSPVFLSAGLGSLLPAPAVDPPAKKLEPPPTPVRKVPLAQPDPTREAAPGQETGSGPTDDETGTGRGEPGILGRCTPGVDCLMDAPGPAQATCGDGRVEPGEECDDGDRTSGDGCSAACRVEVKDVLSRMIEGHRISGDPQIAPPETVRARMTSRGEERVEATIKMCLTRDGQVRSTKVYRSTGYPEYDDLLTSRMRSWQYRPYKLASGTAVPVCTVVHFIYRQH